MAGTVSDDLVVHGSQGEVDGKTYFFKELTFTCVGDASAGTIPATTISQENLNKLLGMVLIQVIVMPGTPNPTLNSDVTLTDKYSVDVLGGDGTDALDATGNVTIWPELNGVYGYPMTGNLTLAVANQAVASAEWDVVLVFAPHPYSITAKP